MAQPFGRVTAAYGVHAVFGYRCRSAAGASNRGGMSDGAGSVSRLCPPEMKAFNPPRTADGRPNLQGYWDRTVTSQDIEEHGAGFGQQAGPSLVIDTPDRRIPYQPWALEFRKGMVERFISPLAACSPPGVPRHVYAPQAHQILQMPGHVVHLLDSPTRIA